jgi:hypothetical protein
MVSPRLKETYSTTSIMEDNEEFKSEDSNVPL